MTINVQDRETGKIESFEGDVRSDDGLSSETSKLRHVFGVPVEKGSLFGRGRAAVRQIWKDWVRGTKSGISNLEPDLSKDELNLVRHHIDDCLAGRGGQVSARARAAELGRAYLDLSRDGKRRFFELLVQDYKPDRVGIHDAAQKYIDVCVEIDHQDNLNGQGQALQSKLYGAQRNLQNALKSPRRELLKQFNSLEQGIKFLVDLRADLIKTQKEMVEVGPEWLAFDKELRDLLESWFDVGFLNLQKMTWDAPASLLEKLVRYEAVHPIRSTDDLRNRLESDRRCYAFFHPNMPDEPLIFVEVALTNGISDNVQELLDRKRETDDPETADTAIFYSISNAQAGLASVAFGDFLIKRVVRELTHDLPKLKTFSTLSPIPGFRRWLYNRMDKDSNLLMASELAAIEKIGSGDPLALLKQFFVKRADRFDEEVVDVVKPILTRLCAVYLNSTRPGRNGRVRAVDPVGHFHLSNGARIERLNWLGDNSIKGLDQSAGLMVNYLYKLSDIERNHEAYTDDGDIPISSGIKSIL